MDITFLSFSDIKNNNFNINKSFYTNYTKFFDFGCSDAKTLDQLKSENIIYVVCSKSLLKKHFLPGNIPVISGGKNPIGFHSASNYQNIIILATCGEHAGCVQYYKNPIFASNATVIFSLDENKLLTKYLYFVLKSYQDQIYRKQHGNLIQHVFFNNIADLKVPLKSISKQQEIVNELNSYENIIDGARQIINNWKPGFEVDKNWEIIKIGDYTEIKYGYKAINDNRSNFRYIRTTDISDSFTLKNKPVYINTFDNIDNFLIKKHDVLITRSGSVGKSFIALEDMHAVFASYLVRLRFNQSFINPLYFIYYSNTDHYWSQVGKLSDVLTQQNLNAEKIKMIEIPLPPLHIQQEIVEQLEQERKMIDSQKEIIKLFEVKLQNRLNSLLEFTKIEGSL